MEASGKPTRISRVRLLLLVAIAFVGYEYVLYRHWVTSVPLLPTTTLDLPRDRVPIGFVGSGEFTLGRHLEPERTVRIGLLEFRSFPSGEKVAERLTEFDTVAPALPITSSTTIADFEYSSKHYPISYGAPVVAHHRSDSPRRAPTFYCINRDHFLCISDETLQSYDPNTDRVRWSLSRIHGVVSVDGDYAFVTRMRREAAPGGLHPVYPVLVTMRDGSCDERVFPAGGFELSDISPDGRLIVYLLSDAIEVWSIETGSRVWRKTTTELGTRQLTFSNDSQRLVSWTLNEAGEFQSRSFRASDGERLRTGFEPDDPRGSIDPAIASAGSKYAFFHDIPSLRSGSNLSRWLQSQARRVGLFVTPISQRRMVTLLDVERGTELGVVDTTLGVSLRTASDGSGFALFRPGGRTARLEFYTLPPRFNWLWWSVRAIGVPFAILAVAIGLPLWRRRITEIGLPEPL